MRDDAMNEHDALLRSILSNPDDDTVRLVFAEYLEEIGQSKRAQFIRHSIESGETHRERILHAIAICGAWPKPWPIGDSKLFGAGTVRRGFIEKIEVFRPQDFMVMAPELFNSQPIICVELHGCGPVPEAISPNINGFTFVRSRVPIIIWNCLQAPGGNGDYKYFYDEKSALDEMSRTCVRLGRQTAGLPEQTLYGR